MITGFHCSTSWVRQRARVVALLGLLTLLVAGNTARGEPAMEAVAADGSTYPVEPVALLDPAALEELVGPIALYPDDLLAIALPAATYPLQVVQASRFLQSREENPSVQPAEGWDDSVVALLNYPEVVELLNEDLDWTWKLGEAVLAQQEDVLEAVAAFRERARLAGNLRSDDFQLVESADEGIRIRPRDPEVIYVPYYEPSRVTAYHSRPVYHYYPARYPVYYYPYAPGHRFASGFWGVTSAFSIGWTTRRLHVHYVTYRDHPYYGHHYYDRYFYRRPPSFRVDDHWQWHGSFAGLGRHHAGNYWYPRAHRHGPSPRHHHRRSHHEPNQDEGTDREPRRHRERERERAADRPGGSEEHLADRRDPRERLVPELGPRRAGRLLARGSVVNGIPVPESAATLAPRPARPPAAADSPGSAQRRPGSPIEAQQAIARARSALGARSAARGGALRAQRSAGSPRAPARAMAGPTPGQQSTTASPSRSAVAVPSRPAPMAFMPRSSPPRPAVPTSRRLQPAPSARTSRPSQPAPSARTSRPAFDPGTISRRGGGVRAGRPTPMRLD